MIRGGSVYMITTNHNTALYIGVTTDLLSRTIQYQKYYPKSFTAQYNVCKLVYYEHHGSIVEAVAREKQLKRWSRIKKERLINAMNPKWQDLFEDIKDW
ncbi:MAG: GIY-YIG nuclease family protein [Cyclobacteriaceae bacterium]